MIKNEWPLADKNTHSTRKVELPENEKEYQVSIPKVNNEIYYILPNKNFEKDAYFPSGKLVIEKEREAVMRKFPIKKVTNEEVREYIGEKRYDKEMAKDTTGIVFSSSMDTWPDFDLTTERNNTALKQVEQIMEKEGYRFATFEEFIFFCKQNPKEAVTCAQKKSVGGGGHGHYGYPDSDPRRGDRGYPASWDIDDHYTKMSSTPEFSDLAWFGRSILGTKKENPV